MVFTKILCPTDFSPGADRALRLATRLARESNAELVIAHAWYIPPSAYSLEAPFPPFMVQQLIDDAHKGLDAAKRDAIAAGAPHVSTELLNGSPWSCIVRQLEHEAFDLCVIGTHGRTGLARIFLGSVAEKVVRHARCSVMTVRPDGELQPFQHALVPTDFSEYAQRAVDLATEIIPPKGRITLLHAIELPVAYTNEFPFADIVRELDVEALTALGKTVEAARMKTTATLEAAARVGYPGYEILTTLDDDRTIDLVIIGSHGRTGLSRAFLGSVAEKIVRHSRCPVLVARKRG
ncbi:MAG: universal stress protein [Kofleriaceae bacterium]